MPEESQAHSEVGRVQQVRNQIWQVAKVNGAIRSRGPAPATTKDTLKAFLLVLSNAENGIILQIQALESSVSCDQELNGRDHAGVDDEVEEPGDVLLKEDEVVRRVIR